jgi:hypothetical protein
MEWEVRQPFHAINIDTISPQFLFNPLSIELHEEVDWVPKVGDLWILVFIVCPHHLIRLFLPRIDNLFIVGNKVVRVEHVGIKSKAFVWRLGRSLDGKWLWNFEHDDKVQYESHQLSIGMCIVVNKDPSHDLELY